MNCTKSETALPVPPGLYFALNGPECGAPIIQRGGGGGANSPIQPVGCAWRENVAAPWVMS
jgi:hypothetical protein